MRKLMSFSYILTRKVGCHNSFKIENSGLMVTLFVKTNTLLLESWTETRNMLYSLICDTFTVTGLDVFSAAMCHLPPPPALLPSFSMKARMRQAYAPPSSPLTPLTPSLYSPAPVRSSVASPRFPCAPLEDVLEITTPLRSMVMISRPSASQVTSRARAGRLSAATEQRRVSALPGVRSRAAEEGEEEDEAFTLRD